MAAFNCHEQMHSYHDKEVTLNKAQQDIMRERRNAGRARLKSGLERDGKPPPTTIACQGSYAMRTMVQDPASDYDIDDGVYFERKLLQDQNGHALSPLAARGMICHALVQDERLKYPAEVRENCVRQIYPEGYHIDIPVYRILPQDENESSEEELYELASGNNWEKSDARAVTRWFNDIVGELNADTPDGSQLRRITKLTKKFARSRAAWKASMPSGIALTVLVVDDFVSATDRCDESLLSTWKRVSKKLSTSPQIRHPVQTDKPLAVKGDVKVEFFRSKLDEALESLREIEYKECTQERALELWDKVFSTSFFSDQLPKDGGTGGAGGAGGKGTPPFVKTSEKVPQRKDGDGRFG